MQLLYLICILKLTMRKTDVIVALTINLQFLTCSILCRTRKTECDFHSVKDKIQTEQLVGKTSINHKYIGTSTMLNQPKYKKEVQRQPIQKPELKIKENIVCQPERSFKDKLTPYLSKDGEGGTTVISKQDRSTLNSLEKIEKFRNAPESMSENRYVWNLAEMGQSYNTVIEQQEDLALVKSKIGSKRPYGIGKSCRSTRIDTHIHTMHGTNENGYPNCKKTDRKPIRQPVQTPDILRKQDNAEDMSLIKLKLYPNIGKTMKSKGFGKLCFAKEVLNDEFGSLEKRTVSENFIKEDILNGGNSCLEFDKQNWNVNNSGNPIEETKPVTSSEVRTNIDPQLMLIDKEIASLFPSTEHNSGNKLNRSNSSISSTGTSKSDNPSVDSLIRQCPTKTNSCVPPSNSYMDKYALNLVNNVGSQGNAAMMTEYNPVYGKKSDPNSSIIGRKGQGQEEGNTELREEREVKRITKCRNSGTINAANNICSSVVKSGESHVGSKEDMSKILERWQYLCPSCMSGFNDSDDLENHMKDHNEMLPYKCDECGLRFTWKHTLKRHILRHLNPPKVNYLQCNNCNKSFLKKKKFEDHLKLHKD
ncbi:gastrula zinc finger protein XlCGF48.2-like isoform X1 [Artemia franciscana]|uniref:gastrula zinc finger protein XlCGF48.2-like isoform X1 n=1 Tax=Artemia franciscana TaxID=6661 RepID=UPI0032DA34B1